MFWVLLLCHLIADYPLQTDAMVQAKKRLTGLTLHVGVHLATMLMIVPLAADATWTAKALSIACVTICHFVIDLWKNLLSQLKPQWVIGGYLQDQVLHIASLILAAVWFSVPEGAFVVSSPWIVYLSGYVLVTHVWFATERVLSYRDTSLQQAGYEQRWPRMVSRAIALTVLLIACSQFVPGMAIAMLLASWPYRSNVYRQRFVIIDIAVAVVVTLFVLLALHLS